MGYSPRPKKLWIQFRWIHPIGCSLPDRKNFFARHKVTGLTLMRASLAGYCYVMTRSWLIETTIWIIDQEWIHWFIILCNELYKSVIVLSYLIWNHFYHLAFWSNLIFDFNIKTQRCEKIRHSWFHHCMNFLLDI